MKTENNLISPSYIGWKYYNTHKKAIDKKLNAVSLIKNLFIAFFIVALIAQCLNSLHNAYIEKRNKNLNTACLLISCKVANKDSGIINRLINTANAAELTYEAQPEETTHFLEFSSEDEINYTLKIKNTGSATWKKGEIFLETGPYLRTLSKVKHSSWLNYYRITGLEKDIGPGETASFEFTLQVPEAITGLIQENFQLVINEKPIEKSLVRFFIDATNYLLEEKNNSNITEKSTNETESKSTEETAIEKEAEEEQKIVNCSALTEDEKKHYEQCNTDTNENDKTSGISDSIYKITSEPIIRVGLFYTQSAQRVASDTYYDVYAGDKLIYSGLTPNSFIIVSFDFNKKQYIVTYSNLTRFSSKPIRIIPRETGAILTLSDHESRPAWNTSINYNAFRNIIEFQFSKKTGRLWIINELPINFYLKGLAETSNYSPLEYQKAIVTAARSYALYHYNRGVEYNIPDGSTKHANEHFHLDATYDQVYRGYNSEKIMPTLSSAVDETKGISVTYNQKIVITPYFSRSDGRTRSWEEVWYGGAKPWLKSVSVPEDCGQTLWGHGVGMSARGALLMASNSNKNWEEILTYFYSGTELKKAY